MTAARVRLTATEKRRALRQAMDSPSIAVLPGIFDGFSARLVEQMGYQAATITGAGVTNSRLARPDLGIMGLEANLEATRILSDSVDIPLLGDADNGYGNAVNVYYAISAFEDSGVAGMFLEDQTSPKRCGHIRGKSVVPRSEMVSKVLAALDARRDSEMVIMARTDAAATDGIEEAIARANLYLAAGVDIVFPDALLSTEDIKRFAGEVNGPICINMGFGIRSRATTPLMSSAELEACGVAVAIYPRLLTGAAVSGMTRALDAFTQQVRTGLVEDRSDLCASFEELEGLVGLEEALDMAEEYSETGPRVGALLAGGATQRPRSS